MDRYNQIKNLQLEDCEPDQEFLLTYDPVKDEDVWDSIVRTARTVTYAKVLEERRSIMGQEQVRVQSVFDDCVMKGVSTSYSGAPHKIRNNKKLKTNIAKKDRNEHKGHTFDFNENAEEWVEHALSDNVDKELSQEVFGLQLQTAMMMPQILVFDIVVEMALNKLMDCAAQYPLVALAKGIDPDATVVLPSSGSTVGTLYLMKVCILFDLMRAVRGETTVFQHAPRLYWDLRASLGPRQVQGFGYSFDAEALPEFTALLGGQITFGLSAINSYITLAWPTGLENGAGRSILVNTIPTITEDDLYDSGLEVTEKLWTRLMCMTSKERLITLPDKTAYDESVAAFAQTQDFGAESYAPFARITSEVAIKGSHLWISALDFCKGSERRGVHTYNDTLGPATFAWRILNDVTWDIHVRVVPKQFNLTAIISSITAALVQADVISDDMPTSGPTVQAPTSYIKSTDSGSLVEYVTALVAKRYSEGAAIMAGSMPLQSDVRIVGAGRADYVGYDVLSSVLPIHLVEAFAESGSFLVAPGQQYGKNKNQINMFDFHLAFIPYVCSRGGKTRANAFENIPGGSDTDVMSMLVRMYPKITTGPFVFGNLEVGMTGDLDLNDGDISFFTGSGPINRRVGTSDLFQRAQGNIDVGPGLASVHDQSYTNLYYTEFIEPFQINQGWDATLTSKVHSIGNKIPFDPNMVSHCLTRILPIIYASKEDLIAYIGITREVVSLTLNSEYIQEKMSSFIGPVHPVSGWGNEVANSDHAAIEQGIGGGFGQYFKSFAKTALPIGKLLASNLANSYAPGSGSIVNALFDTGIGMLGNQSKSIELKHQLIDNAMALSGRNPYSPFNMPLLHSRDQNHLRTVGKITRVNSPKKKTRVTGTITRKVPKKMKGKKNGRGRRR
jgi:hypothetical protein